MGSVPKRHSKSNEVSGLCTNQLPSISSQYSETAITSYPLISSEYSSSLNMGSSSSSEKADNIESDQTDNYGLLNISSGISSSGYNALEIVTFVLVLLAAAVFLKVFCNRRRKRRLDEMQRRLQEIQLPDYPSGPPAVRAHASRVPIMQGAAPPPVYPGGQLSHLEKYEI